MKSILRTIGLGAAILPMSACDYSPSISPAQWADVARERSNIITLVRPGIAIAQPTVLSHALSIAPAMEEPIPPCTTAQVATRVVKLRIKNYFRVKHIERDITSKNSSGGGVKTVGEPTLHETKYDMSLTPQTWGTSDKVIAIKVFIKDGQLIFLNDKWSITTVARSMDSSGVEPPSMFICLDPIKYITDHANSEKEDDTSDGVSAWDVATFYVDMTKVQNQKFNIRLIVFDDDKTRYMPIIIDPKVENQG